MSLRRIDHVVLNVRDLERSLQFYTDVLGFKITTHNPGRGAFLSCGIAHHDLALFQAADGLDEPITPRDRRPGLNHAMFMAEGLGDVVSLYERLMGLGTTDVRPTDHGDVRSIYFHDPDGNRIEIGYSVPAEEQRDDTGGFATWDIEALVAAR